MEGAHVEQVTVRFSRSLLLLLLTTAALAQPAPVEILLTLPPDDLYIEQHSQPDWQAPPMLCRLCGEDRSDGSCGCERPLTQELAEQLQDGMPALLEKAFGDRLSLSRPVKVRVIDAATLNHKGRRTAQGLYEDGVIFLSDGLHRREGLAVLAHEYGHAWQYQHRDDIDRVEGLLFEGFAEWVSYHVLAAAGDERGLDDVMRDLSEYGRGARWYLALEKKSGLDAALECARYRMRK